MVINAIKDLTSRVKRNGYEGLIDNLLLLIPHSQLNSIFPKIRRIRDVCCKKFSSIFTQSHAIRIKHLHSCCKRLQLEDNFKVPTFNWSNNLLKLFYLKVFFLQQGDICKWSIGRQVVITQLSKEISLVNDYHVILNGFHNPEY